MSDETKPEEPGAPLRPWIKPPWKPGESGNPNGRPTIYDPGMCEHVLAFAAEGAGRYETAALLGIAMSTLHAWELKYPDFAAAMAEAYDISHGWWEKQGRKGIWAGTSFNANAYALQVKNRFSQWWKDRHEVEVPGGITIRHEDALEQLK